MHAAAKPLADGLVMRTNNVGALLVLEKRVLQHLVADEIAPQAGAGELHKDPNIQNRR